MVQELFLVLISSRLLARGIRAWRGARFGAKVGVLFFEKFPGSVRGWPMDTQKQAAIQVSGLSPDRT